MPITFNPLDVYNIEWNANTNRLNRQMRQDQLQQAQYDNQFRTKQWLHYKNQSDQQFAERHSTLQNLVKDANKAGISPLAALGSGGTSPINLSMPSGQGGRVSGNYQRMTPLQASVTMDLVKKSKIQTQREELAYYQDLFKTQMLSWQKNRLFEEPDLPNKYVRYKDNYDDAVSWIESGDFVGLNPDMNMEVNESVGSYHFSKPYPEGFLNILR